MKTPWLILFTWLSLLIPASLMAAEPFRSSYVGQEKRAIKSLSQKDIQALESGAGWGLAKAAELNGVPGPKHLLEMKDGIKLNADQEKQIRTLFEKMHAQAVPLGRTLVRLEDQLNHAFQNGKVTPETLKQQLDEIARVTAALRYVHLSAHLDTPSILTPQQIQEYRRLRGYDSGSMDHSQHLH